jgi:hypothetical protein
MSAAINNITIPANLTSEAARAHAIMLLNGLQRQVNALQEAVADRDRIIGNRNADIAQLERQIERLETRVASLKELLLAARGGAGMPEHGDQVQQLTAALARWQGFGLEVLGGLKRLMDGAVVPERAADDTRRQDPDISGQVACAPVSPEPERPTAEDTSPAPAPGDIATDIASPDDTRRRDPDISGQAACAPAKRTCSVAWCDRSHVSRGYCYRHYEQLRIHGDALLTKRRVGGEQPVLMREVGPERYEPVG